MNRKLTNTINISDLTGFEFFLSTNGYKCYASNSYLNTYDSVMRVWIKENIHIHIGILADPKMIGVLYPVLEGSEKMPTEKNYRTYLDRLIKKSVTNKNKIYVQIKETKGKDA